MDVIAAPYQGPAIESPWWRAAPNPAQREGDAFKLARDTLRRVTGVKQTQAAGTQVEGESLADRAVRRAAQTVIAPRWRRHVDPFCASGDVTPCGDRRASICPA